MTTNTRLYELLKAGKIDELNKALEENIREEANKKAGAKSSDLSIIKRITSEKLERFQKSHAFTFEGNTLHAFTNGYYALASENSFNYPEADEHEKMDFSRIFEPTKNACDSSLVVDRSDLKAFIKLHSKKEKQPYIITLENGKKIAVNPRFLIDCLDFVGSDEIHFPSIKYDCLKSPMYMENGGKIALLCPVHVA